MLKLSKCLLQIVDGVLENILKALSYKPADNRKISLYFVSKVKDNFHLIFRNEF